MRSAVAVGRSAAVAAALACGLLAPPPAQAQGSYLRAPDFRVAAIAYRIATRGAARCPHPAPLSGMLLHHLAEYARDDRAAMAARGLARGPGVLAVVPGGPAEAAGLRAGDVLLDAGGEAFAHPAEIARLRKRAAWRARIEADEAMLEARLASGAVRLGVMRGGEELSLTLVPRIACPLRIRLAYSPQRTAVTQAGRYVVLTTGLLESARNDDEIAFVIAHELAHIVLEHTARMAAAGVPRRGILRGAGRSGAVVRQTEAEADLLGGELALDAGYDPVRGAAILARLPGPFLDFGLFRTHAPDRERIAALKGLAERRSKR